VTRAVVAGLGNPGARYTATRHNLGFLILERFLSEAKLNLGPESQGVRLARDPLGEEELLLAEPQLFMNRSGPPLADLLQRESVSPESLLVVHDDLDLEAGRLQLKRSGGTGGHRGLDSLVESLGTDVFPRLRVGIGRPTAGMSVVDFVLAPYSKSEIDEISSTIARGVDAIVVWRRSGTESAMNIVNVRGKVP
jgi:PTH1 family peptidyl-tRNA hydrolase